MASAKKWPYAARMKLRENQEALLREYYRNCGDMLDHERIRTVTGLSRQEVEAMAKRLGLIHTTETR